MTKCKIFDIDCPLFDKPKKQCWYNEEHRCSATEGLEYVKKTTNVKEKKKRWFEKLRRK